MTDKLNLLILVISFMSLPDLCVPLQDKQRIDEVYQC